MTGQVDNRARPTFGVNRTKRRRSGVTLPKQGSRSYALLQAMLAGPGTFYQICERAGFDIEEAGMEHRLRMIFSRFIQGNVHLVGIRYVLKDASRAALLGAEPGQSGQVATPHFRGTVGAMPVVVVRRPAAEVSP
ncbi:hypothetical protein [Janthinobacterium lividum]|uniref:hypothetical protein n=1 Tax=Janthinobacterium lividum TaxID=29581 RepID=UPI0015962A00|nr:hypothetical protein [Janthinobacterium lividum]QKY09532.1 hypothetical protein G8765_18435 [Janthinobacterium lividum]